MLKDCRVQAMLPMTDIDRARTFCAEKLDLTPNLELPTGLWYRCGDGTSFGLSAMSLKPADHSQMGFVTHDVEAAVRALRARGVVFEHYRALNTVEGVADLGFVKAAWFNDSEGNPIAT